MAATSSSSAGKAVGPVAPDRLQGSPPEILHLISSLFTGGAEMTLLRILRHPATQDFRHRVISLTPGGTLIPALRDAGVEVGSLGLQRGRPTPAAAWRLARQVRRRPPSLLLGWMYHGNLAASFARRCLRSRPPLVWNIRHTPDDLAREKRLTAALIRWGARISRRVSAVTYNSAVSARLHGALGYGGERVEVLPNGVDGEVFRPSEGAKEALLAELDLPSSAVLVGRVARLHPMKGYPELIRAAGRLGRTRADLHLVLAGRGVEAGNSELEGEISAAGLEGRVHLLGERRDVPHLLAALDVCCSPSLFGEGFPNVVAEALACAVPCVVTDVGDSAAVLGSAGRVVKPGEVLELASALEELLALAPERRRRLGEEGRGRIEKEFSADRVYPRHVDLWRRCIDGEALP